MSIIRYRPAQYSRDNYVKLENGQFVKISEIRVKGETGVVGIPTQKQLQDQKTEFTDATSRREIKLASRDVYSSYEQTNFVIFQPGNGASKEATLNAQIFSAANESNLIPVRTVEEKVLSLSDIIAVLPPESSENPNPTQAELQRKITSLSELVSLAGEKMIRFKARVNGKMVDLLPFRVTELDKMAQLADSGFEDRISVRYYTSEEETMVLTSKLYERKSNGQKVRVQDVSKLLTLSAAGSNFCVLGDDGRYRDITPLTVDTLNKIELASEGQYLLVRLKGDVAHTACPLEHLRLDDGHGNPSPDPIAYTDLEDCVGKKIWAWGGDGASTYELEPLTPDDLTLYSSKKFYRETTSDEDICRDDNDPSKAQSTAYLRLKNGKYVKEIDVAQPKCYNFVSDPATTNYDAYVITLSKGTPSERSYIIDKAKVDGSRSATVSVNINGSTIEFNKMDAQKVVASKGGINNSDVIQTTSRGAKVESCEVLETRRKGINLLAGTLDDETKQTLAARIKKIYAEFLDKYKAKNYDLGGRLLIMNDAAMDGEFEEYLANHRYLLSDVMPMKDFTVSDLKEYLNMPDGGFTFDGEKLTGGRKYDYAKGIKNSYATFASALGYTMAFTFSAGGALASLCAPILLPIMAGVFAAWGIAIPIYHAIKKARVESKKTYKYKNKVDRQVKKTKDEIFSHLSKLVEDFKDKQPEFEKSLEGLSPQVRAQKIQERKQLFLAEMALEETKVDLLSASKSGSQFDMIDGKGQVNQSNAHEYSQYLRMLKDKEGEIKTLKSDIDTLKSKIDKAQKEHKGAEVAELELQRQQKIDLLEVRNGEFSAMRKNYRLTGSDNTPDAQQEQIRERIDRAKGFMMVKYFGESPFNYPDSVLTAEELAEKLRIEEYVKATEISVNKRKRDFEYSYESTKKSERTLTKREWKKRNKSAGSFFSRLRAKGKATVLTDDSVISENAFDAISAREIGSAEVEAEVAAEVVPTVTAEAEHSATPDEVSPTESAPEKPAAKKVERRSLVGLTVDEAEKAIIEVCRAMERLQSITTSKGAYGINDLTVEEEAEVKELKHIFDFNRSVLKAVVNSNGKYHKSLYNKYASDINKAGLRYQEYMTIVENKNVKL